jgi:predicted phage terminase large subunit-like protein
VTELDLRPLPEPGATNFDPKSVADVVERMRLPGGGFCARPVWLQPFIDVLDRAVLHGDVWATASAPPQHSKSTCMVAALIFAALVRPGKRHIYASYAQSRADEAAKDVEAAALDLGLDPHRAGPQIELRGGTTIVFTSVDGSVTGKPCDGLALVDDPVKGAGESRSPTVQKTVRRWYQMDLLTRLHPPSADGRRQGASMVVVMTRWTPEDLIGELQRASRDDPAWAHLRIPAIADDCDAPEQQGRELGSALWPEERPLATLQKRRGADARSFSAQYQGLPVPDGDRVFGNPARWTKLPDNGRRWGFGLDTAGSVKQTADYNVLVQGCLVDGVLYVTNFWRERQELTRWVPSVAHAVHRQPAAVVLFSSGAGDNVAVSLFQRENIGVKAIPTGHDDKLVRVRKWGLIELWEAGRVQFPEDRRWQDVIDECMNFDGLGTGHDDFVDAMVGLAVAVGLPPIGYGGDWFKGIRNLKLRGLHQDRRPNDERDGYMNPTWPERR